MNITILGAGSFGTAMAAHLARLGRDVKIWTIDETQAKSINERHKNNFCFTDEVLSEKISATCDLAEAVDFSKRYIMAVPAQAGREVFLKIAPLAQEGSHLLNLAKGVEISTGYLMHQIRDETCPNVIYSALSGPSHAEEVLIDLPTTVALASRDEREAVSWQKILNGGNFRVYSGSDVTGLEIGGAAKNIYAIAAGVSKALRLGDNALAALASRGLAEMMRLGVKLGASPLTLSGLAGVGDLMVTCYSMHSRNFRLGLAVGEGTPPAEAAKKLGQVAEGVYTTRAIVENGKKFGVETPLAEAVYRVLYKNEEPRALLKELFARPLKPEMRF